MRDDTLTRLIRLFKHRRDEAESRGYAYAKSQGWVKRGQLRLDLDPHHRAEIETWEDAIDILESHEKTTQKKAETAASSLAPTAGRTDGPFDQA